MPVGTILPYAGLLTNIPAGWHLCDGTNGTPNLKDRFLVGVGNNYNLGATGGEASHTLTVDEMPSHNHNLLANTSTDSTGPLLAPWTIYNQGQVWVNTAPNGVPLIGYSGGNVPHENRPPYFAVYYIMKIK